MTNTDKPDCRTGRASAMDIVSPCGQHNPGSQVKAADTNAGGAQYTRRHFVHICGAAALFANGGLLAAGEQGLTKFPTVHLVDSQGRRLHPEDLEQEQEYVFFYPYVCTPCFLIKLGHPTVPVTLNTQTGDSYQWQGGVGPDRSVVAFVAICSHKMTHPSGPVSFIGYRQQPVGFLDAHNRVMRRSAVIQCCSEHSIYDPAEGCRVLAGPAPQPLGSVALDIHNGELVATGVYGGILYERFFERFGFRLQMEFGERALDLVAGEIPVVKIEDYTRQRIQC